MDRDYDPRDHETELEKTPVKVPDKVSTRMILDAIDYRKVFLIVITTLFFVFFFSNYQIIVAGLMALLIYTFLVWKSLENEPFMRDSPPVFYSLIDVIDKTKYTGTNTVFRTMSSYIQDKKARLVKYLDKFYRLFKDLVNRKLVFYNKKQYERQKGEFYASWIDDPQNKYNIPLYLDPISYGFKIGPDQPEKKILVMNVIFNRLQKYANKIMETLNQIVIVLREPGTWPTYDLKSKIVAYSLQYQSILNTFLIRSTQFMNTELKKTGYEYHNVKNVYSDQRGPDYVDQWRGIRSNSRNISDPSKPAISYPETDT